MNSLSAIFVLVCVAIASANVIPEPIKFETWKGRIVGGEDAVSGQFKHQASLRNAANGHFCGAIIISNRWVLSAAHCTIGRAFANTRVVVGTHLRLSGGVSHEVNSIVTHVNYNADNYDNDIGMVRTTSTISFNTLVASIPRGTSYVGAGITSTVSGWGQTSYPGTAPDNLQYLIVSTLTNADCRSRFTTEIAAMVHNNTICTFSKINEGACVGDSGGPLISGGGNVFGIVSWGIACGVGYPDVFARVSSHASWINTHIIDI